MVTEDPSGPEISVALHLLSGTTERLRLIPNETVLEARTQAAELLGRRPRLVFGGRVLGDSETIAMAGVHDGAELTAVLTDGPSGVLTASMDGTLRLFDVETGTCLGIFADFQHGICSVALRPDGLGVLACGEDGSARLLNVETAACEMTFESYAGGDKIYSGAFSPDCSRVVVPCSAFGRGRMHRGVAKVFDIGTGFHVITLAAGGGGTRDPGMIYSAVFSPDGEQVLLATDSESAQLFRADTGEAERTFLHNGEVRSAVFSSDGQRVLTASDDGLAMLFDVRRAAPLMRFACREPVTSACFSSDEGEVLASGSCAVQLFSVASGKRMRTFKGHRGGFLSACFSPGGSKVLSASEDGTAKLFNSATGEGELEFTGHGSSVTSALFTLDAYEGTQW